MSDNIPIEIQMEIIKKVSDIKSLIQFRSVSKTWKSFIDSSDFIKGYGARHTQPHSRILMYKAHLDDVERHICLVNDNIETLQEVPDFTPSVVLSPLLKQYRITSVVGACHGLLCFDGYKNKCYNKRMLVVWNPSIGKSFGIDVPNYDPLFGIWNVYGFGVCPVTSDPTIVKFVCSGHVEVFTLSSGVWNVLPRSNLLRESIELNSSTQVVIDRFIYWGACEMIYADDGESKTNHMVVSFDLITKEFKLVDIPDSITKESWLRRTVSKLGESLVVFGHIKAEEAIHFGVWVMERDLSFRKLFTIGAPVVDKILGFRKDGETIFQTPKEDKRFTTLDVYDPCSKQIKNLGIAGVGGSFFMDSCKESLLLLDHSDLHIYGDNN